MPCCIKHVPASPSVGLSTMAEMTWHGVQLEERGESFYNPFLGPLVAELAGQGIIEDSNGAKV